jgi:membrane-bound serine protease (ClpP class)
MAGYELAAIFVLGLILIAVEIFVLPGFGVPGIFGLMMAVGSLVFSMIDGVKWRQYEWGSGSLLDAISGPAMYLAIGIFGWVGLLYLMFRFVPEIPFLNRTLLNASLAEGTGMETREGEDSRVGMTGEAQTDLHPSGKAEIDGEIVDVVVEGGFARKGDAVRIIKEDGMGIVVKTV